MANNLNKLRSEIKRCSNPKKAQIFTRFFKTNEGDYGFGDLFLGINVPTQRKLALQFKDLSLKEIEELLKSKFHEERLIALFLLVAKFKKANESDKLKIYNLYLNSTKFVNNWDLVDSSADKIVGEYFLDKERIPLYNLAKSQNIWE